MISQTTFNRKLLITHIVIKVIPLYMCISRKLCLRSHSIYNYVVYIFKLYVWHLNFCYGIVQCLCSGLVELIVNVQAQQISNRKYSNSYTINDKYIEIIVYT